MKNTFNIILLGAVVLVLFAAFSASAQQYPTPVGPPPGTGPIQTVGQGIGLLNQILTWVATIFWIAAALFVLYAGFLYLTAGGDTEKVQKANHQLIYAVVAIIVGILAFGLPALVDAFLRRQ